MSISLTDIKNELKSASIDDLSQIISVYENDERASVQKELSSARKRIEKYNLELERLELMAKFENENSDYEFICGIDEVGRGPLAGPVMASAVILPKESRILYINDSKKLSEKKREELFDIIMDEAVSVGIGESSHERIDEINILQATYEAMRKAIAKLDPQPTLLLNDAVTIPGVNIKQIPIIKGDAKSMSIAAASIIAKVTRDKFMVSMDEIYPEYGFASNKGYGSEQHIQALKKYGPTPIHRKSFIGNFT